MGFPGVSILVLVDWRWRPRSRSGSVASRGCFNPCSGGLEMAAPHNYAYIASGGTVSILVLVDWRWRLAILRPDLSVEAVSILVLVDWRWRLTLAACRRRMVVCFNPCSGGLEMAAPHRGPRRSHDHRVSILVLVDWRWRRDARARGGGRPVGFNPCSGGLEMAAIEQTWLAVAVSRFQSLFWWIGDGGH